MKQALLVIDVQQSFLHLGDWSDEVAASFQLHQLALIEYAKRRQIPVVGIFHISQSTPAFFEESGWVAPMDWLPKLDITFSKHVHNAFTDTGLDQWLRKNGIEKIIISGIRTEQCCETTARVACDLGFAVDFVTDATLTFEMQWRGKTYSPQMIKERTECVLSDRFARIVDVATLEREWEI